MVEKYPATMHFWRNHKYDTEQLYFKILNFLLDTHFETQQGSSYKETLLTFMCFWLQKNNSSDME
jgi:hypothetical protein